MDKDKSIAALWAQAEQTAIWTHMEAEKTKQVYYKYITGGVPVDPHDMAIIAKSHEELLLRISAAEIFRTQMIVELFYNKGRS